MLLGKWDQVERNKWFEFDRAEGVIILCDKETNTFKMCKEIKMDFKKYRADESTLHGRRVLDTIALPVYPHRHQDCRLARTHIIQYARETSTVRMLRYHCKQWISTPHKTSGSSSVASGCRTRLLHGDNIPGGGYQSSDSISTGAGRDISHFGTCQ